MASTRNINTRGNYNLEQEHFNLSRNNISYIHNPQGKAYINAMPSIGYMPSRMPRGTLSNNPIEIESMLFGINSTNLVKHTKPIKPDLKAIPTLNFFERIPIHLPKPLVVEHNQRPYPI